MMRLTVAIGLAATLFTTLAQAQEAPEAQLDFVRKLRSKGYADLALQYLEGMQASSSPGAASALLLEKVRTRMALARTLDPERRVKMIDQARGEIELFIKNNPGPSEVMAAKLEKARLSTFQGQALLSRALREDNIKAQQQAAVPAEQMFIQAGKEIEEATKGIKDDDDKRQARFDLAINMMDQARTYIDLSGNDLNAKRATLVDNARKIFEKVYEEDKKGALGVLAAAWLVKCCQEGDDPGKAKEYYKAVMETPGRSAEPAQRWARYFRIEGMPRNPAYAKLKPDQRIIEIEKEAQAWLKDYPSSQKTPAGYGVRYELARALVMSSQLTKDAKVQTAKVKQAQDILSSMNESDNDFTEKSNQLNISLSIKSIGEKGTVNELNTFDDCFLRAQVELSQIKKIANAIEDAKTTDEATKLEKKRQEAFRTVIRSLHRGLALADTKVAPSKIDEARYFLVASYMMAGDSYRAAVAGEAMALSQPPTAKSPTAAGYAIEAYANIYGREKSENNRARLRKLADYVLSPENQKQWANEPVTGVAHYQLAMLHNRDGNTKLAMEHLQKLPKEFPGILFAQGQLVLMAIAARDKTENPKEKEAYQGLVRKVLAGMPKPTPATDGGSSTMYFYSQLEEAKILYAEAADHLAKNDATKALAKYQQMGTFVDGLTKDLAQPTLKLSEDKSKLAYFLDTMRKYARLGLAEVDYRNGQYDKVLGPDQTGVVVEQMKKLAAGAPEIKVKDYQVTGDILGLALRANVQKGNVEEAKNILKVLEKIKGVEDNAFADSTGVLKNLVNELKDQLRELQRANNPEKLKKTVANFSDFVDALVKQAEKKGMDKRDIFFLARCYDSLDQHEKAAGLYAKYPVPKVLEKNLDQKKKEKFSADDERDLQTYWLAKVREARQLRLAKKVPEAKKLLDKLMEHKNARQKLAAEKELVHCMEDSGLYGLAIPKWAAYMNDPILKKQLGNDPDLKESYFDAYYHLAVCWYKLSQTDKARDAGKDAQYLNKAVDYIQRLETSANQEGWQIVGPKFRILMQNEKMLDAAYKRVKGAG